MANPVPLDPAVHSGLRVRNAPDLSITEGQQVLPVTVHEFSHVAIDCPLVFIKHPESGKFQAVALLGLAQGENLLLQNDTWLGNYYPGSLRLAPFKLMLLGPETDRVTVGIDTDSPLVNESEGELLFNESGELSEYMEKQRDKLENYFQQGQVTQVFMSLLAEKDLLVAQSLTMDFQGVKVRVDGIYRVDEKKLSELSDEDVLDLNRRNFMQAIHAHLISLRQAGRLARIKVESATSGGPSIRGL